MDGKYILGSISIACITAIECTALATRQDGTFLSISIGAISAVVAGVAGYTLAKKE